MERGVDRPAGAAVAAAAAEENGAGGGRAALAAADGGDAAAPAGGGGDAAAVAVVPMASVGAALARALLALACTIRFDGEDGGAGATEEAWAASGWRPRADEVSHLMVRESMRYAIYA